MYVPMSRAAWQRHGEVNAKRSDLSHIVVRCDKALFHDCGDRQQAVQANNRRRATDSELNSSCSGAHDETERA